MDPISIIYNIGANLIPMITRAFRGRVESESYVDEVLPAALSYVRKNGIPVAAYWYGYVWVLTPAGNVIDIAGGVKADDIIANERERLDWSDDKVQAYANSIQTPVAMIYGVFDPPIHFKVVYPNAEPTEIITPISTDVPSVGPSAIDYTQPDAGLPAQAGFFGSGEGMSNTQIMLAVGAGAALLALVMRSKW